MSLLCTIFADTKQCCMFARETDWAYAHVFGDRPVCKEVHRPQLYLRQGLILAMCNWGHVNIHCGSSQFELKWILQSTSHEVYEDSPELLGELPSSSSSPRLLFHHKHFTSLYWVH